MVVLQRLKAGIVDMAVVIVLLALSAGIYFLYFINQEMTVRVLGTGAIALLFIAAYLFKNRQKPATACKKEEAAIRKFVLITREGEIEKEWFCKGVTSFLIGKGSAGQEVDIDLSDTYYAQYVSQEHAVLNYAEGYWYIEDLHSANGVGLKKRGDEYSLRLKPFVSYKVDEGDMIYIAKIKILAG